jgi:DNA-binding beta-propeller fold protein YncE
MRTDRLRGATLARSLLVAFLVVLLGLASPAFAAQLQLARTIRTSPFVGSTLSMKDSEGSAYVPRDNSLWLADDNGGAVFEIDPNTGTLKRKIGRAAFEAAPKLGGGPQAGTNRTRDFESMAYDEATDSLYVFSGPCCTSSVLPTAFRLKRSTGGRLNVDSFQPLAAGADYTGAGWNSGDGKIYVAKGAVLRSYNYVTNTAGAGFKIPLLTGITGMDFSSNDLYVTTNAEKLRRVDWASKTLVAGWTFDLLAFDVRDSRAVESINGQFYVSDGYDGRPVGDPLRHAVFVFNVLP